MLRRRIELRLNFDEVQHSYLAERIAAAIYHVSSEDNDPSELAKLSADIREAAQVILKSEWNRVKSLT